MFSRTQKQPVARMGIAPLRITRLVAAAMVSVVALIGTVVPAVNAQAQGPANFVFEGRGWGHGVGMSQNGARNMATAGYDHVGILTFYYPDTIVGVAPSLGDIKVHIGDAPSVTMRSAGSISFERGGTTINSVVGNAITVEAHDGGLQIGSVWTPSPDGQPVVVSFPQVIKIDNNGHSYMWGKLLLTNHNGKVRVIEQLSLEQYVAGISEMPAAWPLEALMAQAIAARTYAHNVALHRRSSPAWEQDYDISATTVDQNYIGWDAQDGEFDLKWIAAVKATAGVEVVDANGPIRAYYAASNGGYTETAKYVFNFDAGYTVAGPDQWDAGGHPWSEWSRTYSRESLSRWLNADNATAVGTVQSLTVTGGAGASARLDRAPVEIVGSDGTKTVSGKKLMLVINAGVFGEGGGLSQHLPGTFVTLGNGTGAGLPQPSGSSAPDGASQLPVVDANDHEADSPAPNDDASDETSADDAADVDGPPPGWTPAPGTGVEPIQREQAPGDDAEESEQEATEGAAGADTSGDAPDSDAETTEATSPTPPPDWTPEPGTGVEPSSIDTDTDTDTDSDVDNGDAADGDESAEESTTDTLRTAAPTPPPDWTPEPGTGVPPIRRDAPVETAADPVSSGPSTVVLLGADGDTLILTTSVSLVEVPTDLEAEVARQSAALTDEIVLARFADFDLASFTADQSDLDLNGVCAKRADEVIVCLPTVVFEELFAQAVAGE